MSLSSATATPPVPPIRQRRSAPPGPATPAPPVSPVAVVPPAGGDPARAGLGPRPGRGPWQTRIQLALALLCWAALAGIVYQLNPAIREARASFFVALFGALFFTLVPVIRGISLQFAHSRVYQEAVGTHATRQALMLALLVVLYALLQMQRSLTLLGAVLLFGIFAVIEIVALTRR